MHTFFSSLPPHVYIIWMLCFLVGAVIALTFYSIKMYITLEMLEISHEDKIRTIYILRKDFGRLDSDVARLAAKIHYNKTPMGYDNSGMPYYGGGNQGVGGWAGSGGAAGGPGSFGGVSAGGGSGMDENGQPIKIVGKEPR